LAEVGGFPTLARPRVVWIGVQGETNALAALARRLDGELHRVGFPRETRAFRAHLTLGRCKRPATLVDSTLVEVPDRPFVVDHAVVMESRLSPHGAEYHALKVLPFDGGSPGNRLPDTG
jgi:2'-5' RNA ligase